MKKKPVKRGSTHSGGTKALVFKKGSKNDTKIPAKVRKEKLRTEMPATKMVVIKKGSKRQIGETIPQYLRRKDKNRK